MKTKFIIVILTACLLLITKANSQITNLTNVATGSTEYTGWDGSGGNSKHLDIKNNFGNKNINFSTNNGTTLRK